MSQQDPFLQEISRELARQREEQADAAAVAGAKLALEGRIKLAAFQTLDKVLRHAHLEPAIESALISELPGFQQWRRAAAGFTVAHEAAPGLVHKPDPVAPQVAVAEPEADPAPVPIEPEPAGFTRF